MECAANHRFEWLLKIDIAWVTLVTQSLPGLELIFERWEKDLVEIMDEVREAK